MSILDAQRELDRIHDTTLDAVLARTIAQRDRLKAALQKVRQENHWTTVHDTIDAALKECDNGHGNA
jgi:hypothetical protein